MSILFFNCSEPPRLKLYDKFVAVSIAISYDFPYPIATKNAINDWQNNCPEDTPGNVFVGEPDFNDWSIIFSIENLENNKLSKTNLKNKQAIISKNGIQKIVDEGYNEEQAVQLMVAHEVGHLIDNDTRHATIEPAVMISGKVSSITVTQNDINLMGCRSTTQGTSP